MIQTTCITRFIAISVMFVLLTGLFLFSMNSWPFENFAYAAPAQQTDFDCGAVTEIPQIECEALVALYESTDGANWNVNTGWLSTTTPCSWYGVTCNLGRVSGLALDSNQLNGPLPPQIGDLTALQHLDLQDNQLSGDIPSKFKYLSYLLVLDLSNNQLSGIHPDVSSLLNLLFLDLGYNSLVINDNVTLTFLAEKNPDWEGTQIVGSVPPTNTPTVTPTPSSYEPNNRCNLANHIPTNGTSQEHTFHDSTDLDWVHFEPIINTHYAIEADILNGSLADISLELYQECGEELVDAFHASFSPNIRIVFKATSDAPIYLRLANHSEVADGNESAYELSVQPLPDSPPSGAVILLAGRYKHLDSLQDNIHNVTDAAFTFFRGNGYENEDIQYLATDPNLIGYDKAATKDNLKDAITKWATNKVGQNNALTLYLIDHGDKDILYIDQPAGESVTSVELNQWLNELEKAKPGVLINVIIEACHSGSFIKALSKPNTTNRVIVTSTNVTWDAYASLYGAHFSDYLFTSLQQGRNLFKSFLDAQQQINDLYPKQQPWLEANGNGIPNEDEDYAIASERTFAYAGNFIDSWPPYITLPKVSTVVDGLGTIKVEARDNYRVADVWAVIYPPSYKLPDSGVELVQEGSDSSGVILVRLSRSHCETYSIDYPGFTKNGSYRIAVHAKDDDGLIAQPVMMEVDVKVIGDDMGGDPSQPARLFFPMVWIGR